MKRLAILTMVLSMMGISSAGLIFTMEEDVLTIEGENVFGFLLSIELVDVGADMGTLQLYIPEPIRLFPTEFDLPGKTQHCTPDGLYCEVTQSNIFGPPRSGAMLEGITWTGQGVADLVVSALPGGNRWDGEVQPAGELYRYHIPEPASMVLLGLGALLVRRCR
ncbi:MAG: PEP-CTERM sorting domain-containing protein [Sedimentisphaerales bacterium]|nr:PEP-CTERM sorting domain-containing protein [Sedimentisphaerales bacterium]